MPTCRNKQSVCPMFWVNKIAFCLSYFGWHVRLCTSCSSAEILNQTCVNTDPITHPPMHLAIRLRPVTHLAANTFLIPKSSPNSEPCYNLNPTSPVPGKRGNNGRMLWFLPAKVLNTVPAMVPDLLLGTICTGTGRIHRFGFTVINILVLE